MLTEEEVRSCKTIFHHQYAISAFKPLSCLESLAWMHWKIAPIFIHEFIGVIDCNFYNNSLK